MGRHGYTAFEYMWGKGMMLKTPCGGRATLWAGEKHVYVTFAMHSSGEGGWVGFAGLWKEWCATFGYT